MEYKVGDILECVVMFSTRSLVFYEKGGEGGRIIDEGDIYEVVDLDFVSKKHVYIKEKPVKKGVVYAETIAVSVKKINKYFKCKRIERKRKLKKLNKLNKTNESW